MIKINFKIKLKNIPIREKINKLLIYKYHKKCIICENKCNKFIKSPCCNDTSSCLICILNLGKCVTCLKDIDLQYYKNTIPKAICINDIEDIKDITEGTLFRFNDRVIGKC